jgi:hypothetical protein
LIAQGGTASGAADGEQSVRSRPFSKKCVNMFFALAFTAALVGVLQSGSFAVHRPPRTPDPQPNAPPREYALNERTTNCELLADEDQIHRKSG